MLHHWKALRAIQREIDKVDKQFAPRIESSTDTESVLAVVNERDTKLKPLEDLLGYMKTSRLLKQTGEARN